MKGVLETKLRETEEWKERCKQLEARLYHTNDIESKLKD